MRNLEILQKDLTIRNCLKIELNRELFPILNKLQIESFEIKVNKLETN
jgi:hypothetical protein